MSDAIGRVGSANAVNATSGAAPVQFDPMAEVQYYNIKAIGINRIMGNGDANGVPLGAALHAYTGDVSAEPPPSSTRALLQGGFAGFPTPDDPQVAPDTSAPQTGTTQQPNPFMTAPPSDPQPNWTQPTNAAPGNPYMTPAVQPATGSNPYMTPSVQPAGPPQVQPPVQSAVPADQGQMQPPVQSAMPAPTQQAQAPMSAPPSPAVSQSDDDRDADTDKSTEKKPWHLDSVPQNERDFALDSPLDDRPQDTWAPTANRSREFAALDNMKLTSPEEALAQWRQQQEAASRDQATVAAMAPPPAPAQAQGSPQMQVAGEQPAQPAVAPTQAAPVSPSAPGPAPAAAQAPVDTAPGNPWMAPAPAAGPAPQGPAMPSQAMPMAPQQNAGGAPVDLSQGSYSNPNLNGNVAPLTTAPPIDAPHVDQTIPKPNMPMLNFGQPQSMYQNRFQNLASALDESSLFADQSDDDQDGDDKDENADLMGIPSLGGHAKADEAGYGSLTPALPVGSALLNRLGTFGA